MFKAEVAVSLRDALERMPESRAPIRVRVTQGKLDQPGGYDVVTHPPAAASARGEIHLTLEPPLQTLPLAEARQSALFNQMGPLSAGYLYIYDLAKGRTRYAHPNLGPMLGIIEGRIDLGAIQGRLHPSDGGSVGSHVDLWRQLKDGEICSANMRVRTTGDGWIWLKSRARVFDRSRDGAVRLIIGAISDVTVEERLKTTLAETAQALADAEDKERRRIGRELHDSTAQHLVAIDLSLSALERRMPFTADDQSLVGDIRGSLTAAHREVRTSAYMLHPPQLESRGLEATLQAFVLGFGRRSGLEISLRISGLRWPLSGDVELALFRIAQEGLMNVYRHAGATHVAVRLHQARTSVWLEVEDNGVGLPDGVTKVPETGVGISSMRARAEQLGGSLLIEAGTRGLRLRATAALEPRGAQAFTRVGAFSSP